VSHRDPKRRRAYQRRYYKSPEQKKKRAAAQARYLTRVRIRIFTRDDYRCLYCGRVFDISYLEVDHKVALAKGGKNNDDNRVTACKTCNNRKSDKPICVQCNTWEAPEWIAANAMRCTKCGAINSFPDGTIAIDPNAEPDWIHDAYDENDTDELGE
jgi:CRISPR/Cas system Type II protein with McrA/HNH and RuvC-like nuclease domain